MKYGLISRAFAMDCLSEPCFVEGAHNERPCGEGGVKGRGLKRLVPLASIHAQA